MLNPGAIWSILKGILTKQSPFYVQYYILAQCHLACRMCNIVEANSDLVPAALDDVERIAKNLKRIGAGVVLLTGGEPFLHDRLPEIVKIFVDNGLSPRLQTAGLATVEKLQACYDAGGRHINVSLDSLVESKQDYINGSRRGSWRQAIEVIANINQVFGSRRRLCALGCVLSRMNWREIPAIVEFATRIGWWVSLVPVHITPPDNPLNFRGADRQFAFRSEDHAELDDLLERLVQMKRTHLLFDSESFLRSSFDFLKTGEVTWRRFNDGVCDSPNLYFAVLPNGDFAVCCDHRYQGKLNLADPRFPSIYRSREFREAVRETTSTCGGCNYGSYPEMSLLARDPKALLERGSFMVGRRNPKVPAFSAEQMIEIAAEIREAHGIEDYEPNWKDEKPAAASQRYGESKIVTRREGLAEWSANRDLLRERAYKRPNS
ncbi:MAG: radical SAM protein [Planctomycetota bacterium]